MAFYERERPLAALADAWNEVQHGQGLLALVSGEAGIGKTTLIREFVRTHASGKRVLLGSCDSLSTPRPLGPLLDILASTPELRRVIDTRGRRDQIFGAVLAEVSRREPTLLVVEDAHWADAASVDLMRFLGRRVDSTRALLVVTFREDEVGPQHPLRLAIGDLATSGRMRRLRLEPLSEGAVQAMATGTGLDSHQLYHQTGGNPFFLTELMAQPSASVPENIRDAVLARVARLAERARRTVEAAATVGATVELSLMSEILGAELLLAPCVEMGLIRAEGPRLLFRHEISREAILSVLPPERLRQLHSKILAALRSRAEAALEPARLAHHAAGACDAGAVLEFAVAAAKQAQLLRSHREAAAQFARALAAGGADGRRRTELLEAYSIECYLTGRLDEAIETCKQAVTRWRAHGEALRHGAALRWLSRFNWFAGLNAEAERSANDAIVALERLQPGAALAAAYSNAAQLRMLSCKHAESQRWARKALALARRLNEHGIEIHALCNLGSCQLQTSRPSGWRLLRRSLQLSLAAGLDDDAARAWANLISYSVMQRRLTDAEDYLVSALPYTDEHGLDGYRFYFLGWRALVNLHRGKLQAALLGAEEVLRRPGLPLVDRIYPLTILGRVRARRGDGDPWPPLDEALDLASRTGELQRLGPVSIARAEAAWFAGDDARARTEAARALPLALEVGDPWTAGELLLSSWRAGAGKLRLPRWCPTVFRWQMSGRAGAARRQWERLGCPLEAALALADLSDEQSLRSSFVALEHLEMHAAAARVAGRLRALGSRHVPRGRRPSTRAHPAGLTTREAEILTLLSEGLRNAEIGRRLFISAKTVDHHVSAILDKLNVRDRAQAARWRPPEATSGRGNARRMNH